MVGDRERVADASATQVSGDLAMPKFVVYEVWTKARVVEAETQSMAYDVGDPDPRPAKEYGMSLCNWHAVAIDPKDDEGAGNDAT